MELSLMRSIVGAALLVAALPAVASPLTYQPINPSFGGNPFNSAHLLGIANAQNKYKDPTVVGSGSEAEVFAKQLQSRLLSALSNQIVDAIFGKNPQQSGIIKFGDQTIEFVRDLQNVTLTITDATGAITTIIVPIFLKVN